MCLELEDNSRQLLVTAMKRKVGGCGFRVLGFVCWHEAVEALSIVCVRLGRQQAVPVTASKHKVGGCYTLNPKVCKVPWVAAGLGIGV